MSLESFCNVLGVQTVRQRAQLRVGGLLLDRRQYVLRHEDFLRLEEHGEPVGFGKKEDS